VPEVQVPRFALSLVPVAAVFELIVGATVFVAETFMGPKPALYLLATPELALLVRVVMVSLATKYFPSQSLLSLMLEKFAVTPVGLAKEQDESRLSDAVVRVVQEYQVYAKVPVLCAGEPLQAPVATATVEVFE
jgi:hypothetical protein